MSAEVIDLRTELGASPDPRFELTLPPGWARFDNAPQLEDEFRARLKQRMMELHRPDLYVQADAMLKQAFAGLKEANATALFMGAGSDEDAWLPASMIASTRTPSAQHSLDQLVAQMIRKYGARPVHGDPRWIRFEQDRKQSMQDQEFIITLISYLTPIPRSGRKRALELTVTIMRPADAPADDAPMQAMRALFDACVTTLRWQEISEQEST